MQLDGCTTWVEISEFAIKHNLKQLRKILGDKILIFPCVKGNGYGHGIIEVSSILEKSEANGLAVVSLDEAKKIRSAGIKLPIFIMGYVPKSSLTELFSINCSFLVSNLKTLAELSKIAQSTQKNLSIHLKLETGLNRQGITEEEIVTLSELLSKSPQLNLIGFCTHLAQSDSINHHYSKKQYARFQSFLRELKKHKITAKIKSISNSASILQFPEMHLDMVRPGIAIYGLMPSTSFSTKIKLRPALTWKTKITQIKKLKKGDSLGYGSLFTASENLKIAILPVGYYDGYQRSMKNGYTLIHGKKARVLTNTNMNMTMVDITEIPQTKVEDEVILIGSELSASKLADWAKTINYEILTNINGEIYRKVVNH